MALHFCQPVERRWAPGSAHHTAECSEAVHKVPAIMEAVARVSVQAGITTMRDFCTSCSALADDWRSPLLERQIELRDRILAGEVPGPRLYLSGPVLGQAGGMFVAVVITANDSPRFRAAEPL